MLVRRVIPADNSCLFNAVGYPCFFWKHLLFLSFVLSFASLPAADPATWEKHQDLLGGRKHVELCVRSLLFVFAGDLYQYLAHG